jgi:hypothetical protein
VSFQEDMLTLINGQIVKQAETNAKDVLRSVTNSLKNKVNIER